MAVSSWSVTREKMLSRSLSNSSVLHSTEDRLWSSWSAHQINPSSERAAVDRKADSSIALSADDYESLPETSTLSAVMIAGGVAGIAEHAVMYPVDSVKTRMQSLAAAPQYRSITRTLLGMLRNEGLRVPFRGVGTVAAGAGPAHALYFSCYETAKDAFSGSSPSGGSHIANASAGAIATIAHDGFMNPVDVIKQRLQMANSPFSSAWRCALHLWKTEGLAAFYRSYTTQLTMNIPFQSTNFVVYEAVRRHLNPSGQYNPKAHIFAGAMAGAAAAAVSNPLDVAKTLLNTQESAVTGQNKIFGMWQAVCVIHQQHGIGGFTRGLRARVVFQAPATAICWSVYELFKHMLSLNHEDTTSASRQEL